MLRTLIVLYGLLVFLLIAVLAGLLLPSESPGHVAILALISGVIALLPAFVVRRWLTRPLSELHEATRKITRGEYGQKVYGLEGAEFGELARDFNAMSDEL